MDAKLRANFINSVAGREKVPCPNCNALNNTDVKFCSYCGTSMENQAEIADVSYAPQEKESKANENDGFKESEKDTKILAEYKEPESAFAKGLPSWNIEPPQTWVRRKR